MFNFQLQMAQAKALILGLLKSRTTDPKIISVKTIAVARMFNTYIGKRIQFNIETAVNCVVNL